MQLLSLVYITVHEHLVRVLVWTVILLMTIAYLIVAAREAWRIGIVFLLFIVVVGLVVQLLVALILRVLLAVATALVTVSPKSVLVVDLGGFHDLVGGW